MKVSEAFLVNTKNFEPIIETLAEHHKDDAIVNSSLLESLGYSDPNDFLVVRLLKDFEIINNDGAPGKYYEEFQNQETTKVALAKGLVSAYKELFDQYPSIHQEKPEKIKEHFEEIFKGKKTDLIIKYISGTFQKVVSYIGTAKISEVLKGEVLEEAIVDGMANTHKNGAPDERDIHNLVDDFDAKKQEKKGSSDDDTEMTVQEYQEDEEKIDEDTPFDFKDLEDSDDNFVNESEQSTIEDQPTMADDKQTIDQDPFGLETPLSSVTQNNDVMNTLITEKENKFVQKALLRKSDLLHKMQRWEELLPTLEEIIKRYDDDEHVSLKEAVSRSVIRRAMTLLKLKQTDKALPALSSVISRFKDSENKEFYDQASMAMLHKAHIIESQGGQDLLPLYNIIISRLDSSSEMLVKEKLDQIHLKRYDLILQKGDTSEILDASTKLVKRFKDSDEHLEYLQKAMMKRAEVLDEMHRDEEALQAYDEFLAVFGN